MSINIIPMIEDDMALVAGLTGSWVEPEFFRTSIFSCPGYDRYLRQLAVLPARVRSNLLIGAYDNRELLGFAEWRRIGDVLFLNNLYVDPNCRGEGIGKNLIEFGKRLAVAEERITIALDAFASESKTIAWYERLGFQKERPSYTYSGPNPYGDSALDSISDNHTHHSDLDHDFELADYSQSEAIHAAYGFSTLNLRSRDELFSVGRIAGRFFRLSSEKDLYNVLLLQRLAQIDPKRFLLVPSSSPQLHEQLSLRMVCSHIRMKLTLNQP